MSRSIHVTTFAQSLEHVIYEYIYEPQNILETEVRDMLQEERSPSILAGQHRRLVALQYAEIMLQGVHNTLKARAREDGTYNRPGLLALRDRLAEETEALETTLMGNWLTNDNEDPFENAANDVKREVACRLHRRLKPLLNRAREELS